MFINRNFSKINNFFFFTVLSIIVIYGIYLRTKALLNAPDFWFDEIALLNNITEKHIWQYCTLLDEDQCCPPLVMIFGKIVYTIFGINETALKGIGWFFSVSSLFAFVYLSFIFFNKKLPIIMSTFLFAFSQELINYAGLFKQYSSDCLLTILILIFIVHYKNLKDKMNWKHYLYLGIAAVFCAFFSYTAVFLITFYFLILTIQEYFENKTINYQKLLCFLIPFLSVTIFLLITTFLPTKNNPGLQQHWNTLEFFHPNNLKDLKNLMDWIIKHQNFQINTLLFLFGCYFSFRKNLTRGLILTVPIIFGFIFGFANLYPFSASRTILYIFPIIYLLLCEPLNYIDFNNRKILYINCVLYFLYFYSLDYRLYINPNTSGLQWTSGDDYLRVLTNEKLEGNEKFITVEEQDYPFQELAIKYRKHNLNINPKNIQKNYEKSKEWENGTIIYLFIQETIDHPRYILYSNQSKQFINEHCQVLNERKGKLGTLVKCKKIR